MIFAIYIYLILTPFKISFLISYSKVYDLLDYYKTKQKEFSQLADKLQVSLPIMGHISPPKKKLKMEDETFFDRVCNDPEVVKVLIPLRKPYHKHLLPKSILHEHILKTTSLKLPIYRTEQVDKLFFTTLTLDGKQYANRYL